MGRETVLKAALDNPAAAAAIYNRSELYDCLDDVAAKVRKPGESIHQARVRAGSSPEGQAIMAAYAMAARPKPAEKIAPRAPVEELRKSMSGGDVIAQIDKIAADIARKGNISMARARSRAWDENPQLKAQYDKRPTQTHRHVGGGRC